MEKVNERLLNMRGVVTKLHPHYKHARWVTEQEGTLIRDCISLVGARSYLESGTANGYSALWAASGLPAGGNVYTFDPVARLKVWDEDFACPSLMPKIQYIQDGFENLGEYVSKIEHPVVVFIDGDHGGASVHRDWEAAHSILETGDLVIFHDLTEKPVFRALARINKDAGKRTTKYEFLTKRWMAVLSYRAGNAELETLEDNFRPDDFWFRHYPKMVEDWVKRHEKRS